MQELGWTECRMVVHAFADESEAYRYLLQDHGHTVPINADEKIVAVENGVKLGMTVTELAPAMGVTEARAQLWFDLGEGLPQAGRSALARGHLTVNVAELLLQVPETERRGAVQMVLCDAQGEPLAFHAAKNLIQAQYILPARYRRDWEAAMPKLKKKHPVAAGHHFVAWEERENYVQGYTGQPLPEYEFADGLVPRDAAGRLWQDKAEAMGVPIYVVAAPLHADRYVRLVMPRMVRDAESVSPAEPENPKSEIRNPNEEDWEPERQEEPQAELSDDDHLRARLGAVYEALHANPTAAMTTEIWGHLLPALCCAACSRAAPEVSFWLGRELAPSDVIAKVREDTRQRGSLRQAIMLLLCLDAALFTSTEMALAKVEEVLGIKAEG
jgi:hypothetical protein